MIFKEPNKSKCLLETGRIFAKGTRPHHNILLCISFDHEKVINIIEFFLLDPPLS